LTLRASAGVKLPGLTATVTIIGGSWAGVWSLRLFDRPGGVFAPNSGLKRPLFRSRVRTAACGPPSCRCSRRYEAAAVAPNVTSAVHDLKRLRGKQIVRRIGHTRRYEPLPAGIRAMTELVVHSTRGAHNPKAVDLHYQTIYVAMQSVFHELGLAA